MFRTQCKYLKIDKNVRHDCWNLWGQPSRWSHISYTSKFTLEPIKGHIYPVSKHIFGTQCVQLQGSLRVGSSSCQDFAGTGGAAVWKLGSGRWGWEDKQGSWIVSHFPGTCQIGSQPQNHTVKSLLLFKVWVSQVFWLKMFFPSLFNPPLVESVESIWNTATLY